MHRWRTLNIQQLIPQLVYLLCTILSPLFRHFGWCRCPLGRALDGAIQRSKEALIFIQEYNGVNRGPKGLPGWANHKRTFLRKKTHSSHTRVGERKRLIDRDDETAFFRGERLVRKGGNVGTERKSGRPGCSRGETKPWLQSWEKEKARMGWRREGERDGD